MGVLDSAAPFIEHSPTRNAAQDAAKWDGTEVNAVRQWLMALRDRTGATVNAKEYATGDGTTDDTAQIRLAATAATGGTLVIPKGTFKITGKIDIPADTHVRGLGADSVILVTGVDPANAATNYNAIILAAGASIEGVTVRGVYVFDGSVVENQSNAVYTPIGVNDTAVRNCRFENLYGFPVHHEGGGKRHIVTGNVMVDCGNGLNENADHSVISGNVLYRAEGIEASGAYTTIANNILYLCGEGLSLGGRTAPGDVGPGITVTGNVISDCSGHGIVIADGVQDAVVSSNTIVRPQKVGIVFTRSTGEMPTRIQLVGNVIRSAGADGQTPGNAVGIDVGGATSVTLIGNRIATGADTGYTTQYGLIAYGAGLVAIGNTFAGSSRDVSLVGAAGVVWQGNDYAPAKFEAISGTTFAVPVIQGLTAYNDNAAALAAGLVAGDVYRTATGQLMVTYTP